LSDTLKIRQLSGLKPNPDKTVTNPSLKAGVIRHVGGQAG